MRAENAGLRGPTASERIWATPAALNASRAVPRDLGESCSAMVLGIKMGQRCVRHSAYPRTIYLPGSPPPFCISTGIPHLSGAWAWARHLLEVAAEPNCSFRFPPCNLQNLLYVGFPPRFQQSAHVNTGGADPSRGPGSASISLAEAIHCYCPRLSL